MLEEIKKILDPIELPEIVKVRQHFDDLRLPNVREVLWNKLEARGLDIKPGMRIAITCGSRGVDQYPVMIKTVVDFLKSKGAQPVLIPAMGSHGGATAEGQREVLHHNGITEEAMGAPILSSMEVNQIGTTDKGLPVYIDKNACECDGIILLNRVKCHTAFRGKIESGILKMTAIGLAKQKGAEMTHILGFENMAENILAVGSVALQKLNIVCGIGSVEDAFGHLAEVHGIAQRSILGKFLLSKLQVPFFIVHLPRQHGAAQECMMRRTTGTLDQFGHAFALGQEDIFAREVHLTLDLHETLHPESRTLAHGHDVVRTHYRARNAADLAVHGDVAVVDELPGAGARRREAEPVDDVVEPALA